MAISHNGTELIPSCVLTSICLLSVVTGKAFKVKEYLYILIIHQIFLLVHDWSKYYVCHTMEYIVLPS